MAKYSPKENSYKEMYLINKFQKDIMETSLQKLKTTKKIQLNRLSHQIIQTQMSTKES